MKTIDSVTKIAKWMKKCVDEVLAHLEDNCTTYFFPIDAKLQIAIGWSAGFKEDATHYIQDPKEIAKGGRSFYALCAKVCERSNDTYEWLLMPFNTPLAHKMDPRCEVGDVYDTDCSISPNEDYKARAEELLRSYQDIRTGLDNGTLSFSNV